MKQKEKKIVIRERNKKVISFIKAIQERNLSGRIALISEIKPKSPSQGSLRTIKDPVSIAKLMEKNGAACISVLTEENYFNGSIDNLIQISETTTLPLLRKDFLTTQREIDESFDCNADAVLLIVALLKEDTERLLQYSEKAGLEALVEVHNKEELDLALNIGAKLIGINNRDLTTLNIDLSTTERLMKHIPKDKIVISESGVKNIGDAEYLASQGINALLIGSAIMKSPNIAKKIKQLSEVKIK